MGASRDMIYNIEPDLMKEWKDSESMGEYWNNNIRSNKDVEDKASSSDFPIGGCNANLLDPSVVRRFNTRFVAISYYPPSNKHLSNSLLWLILTYSRDHHR